MLADYMLFQSRRPNWVALQCVMAWVKICKSQELGYTDIGSTRTALLRTVLPVRLTTAYRPLAIYLALSVVMTWPLAARLGHMIPVDEGNDTWVHLWTFWWLQEALLESMNPYFTPYLAYPTGVSLTSQNIAWLNFAILFPLQLAFGGDSAYALSYLAIFTLNAYAMYLFAGEQLRSRTAAFLAGLVFGFWPHTLAGAGHPNLILLAWLPLALLYLGRTLRTGGWRNCLLAALFLALLGVTRWQLWTVALWPVGFFVLGELVRHPHQIWRKVVMLLATGGGALILVSPLLLPVVISQWTRPFADELLIYEPAFATDLLSFVVPHEQLSLWLPVVERLPEHLRWRQPEVSFVGYSILTLAVLATVWRWRQAHVWLWIAVALVVLALGPVVTVGQQALPTLPTPYRLVEEWLLNQILRRPDRYQVFLGLPLAMLAGLGFSVLQGKLAARGRTLLLVGFALVILAEYWQHPYPLAATATPVWYEQIAETPAEFGILGVPVGSRLADKFYMYYQTIHRKPIVGGHISRPPRESIGFMAASPFLYDLLFHRTMDPALTNVSHQLRYLAAANVVYLVLHRDLASAEQIASWQDWLVIDPRYQDQEVIVYTTAPQAGVDFDLAHRLTAEIGLIRASHTPTHAQQGDTVTVAIHWGSVAPVAVALDLCIHLAAPDGAHAQSDCQPVNPAWPTDRWQAHEVVRGEYVVQLAPYLPSEQYALGLSLHDQATGQQIGQPATVGALLTTALPRRFDAPAPSQPVSIQLDEVVHLQGYDLDVAGDLSLTLYWQALARMERSYKVFVHLVEGESGAMLAQHDAPPRHWGYPTNWWEAGEVVTETVTFPLPAGEGNTYYLFVGMYDGETGERLAMRDSSGKMLPENGLAIPLTAR
jgi:hypothetical protein